MATSENELQIMADHLNLIARMYKMKISNSKIKSMAMCGNHIQRVKLSSTIIPLNRYQSSNT
jgi:hypothetical protein